MTLPRSISDWPDTWKELWTERAAIMEFQGNLPRLNAEREAEYDIRKLAEKESAGEPEGLKLRF